jgi:two-component system, sensor histidine kinase and response regulator
MPFNMKNNDVKNDVEKTYILIVEDCKEQGELLRHTLTKHNYIVKVAMNGEDALAVMRDQAPNIVFTDIMMPEMDGFELCREIKKDPALAHVPVVLLTASWDMSTILEGLESGADLHFFKPWDKGSLLARTAEMVQKGCFTIEEKDKERLRVQFDGKYHSIPLNRQQILHQLISTYEVVVKEKKKNMKLQLKSK